MALPRSSLHAWGTLANVRLRTAGLLVGIPAVCALEGPPSLGLFPAAQDLTFATLRSIASLKAFGKLGLLQLDPGRICQGTCKQAAGPPTLQLFSPLAPRDACEGQAFVWMEEREVRIGVGDAWGAQG